MPFGLDQEPSSAPKKDDDASESSKSEKESGDSMDDNVILLTGLGRTTQWRVPADTLKCPVLKCREEFEVRSAFIAHFKRKHAPNSVFCELCDRPLSMHSTKDWDKHFRSRHPTHQVPLEFGKKRDRNGQFIHQKSMVCSNVEISSL